MTTPEMAAIQTELLKLTLQSVRSLIEFEQDEMLRIHLYTALQGMGFYEILLKEKNSDK